MHVFECWNSWFRESHIEISSEETQKLQCSYVCSRKVSRWGSFWRKAPPLPHLEQLWVQVKHTQPLWLQTHLTAAATPAKVQSSCFVINKATCGTGCFSTSFFRTSVLAQHISWTLQTALSNFPGAPNLQSKRWMVPEDSWVPSLQTVKTLSQGAVKFPFLHPNYKEGIIFHGKILPWKIFAYVFF